MRLTQIHRVALSALMAVAGPWTPVCPAGEPRPEASPAPPTIERFLRVRAPGTVVVSPLAAPGAAASLLVRDWPNGVWQLYRVDVPAGAPVGVDPAYRATPLTDLPDGVSGFTMSEDGSRVLVFASAGGNENTQIFTVDPLAAGPSLRPVVTNPRVQYSVNLFLRDNSGFVFTGNEESPNDFHVYRYDFPAAGAEPASGTRTKLLAREGSWAAADVSDDKNTYIVTHYRSISDSSVYLLDARTGGLTDISINPESGGTAFNDPVGFMPGERAVLIISDAADGVRRLYRRDLDTGKVDRPLATLDGFELDGAGVHHSRSFMAVVSNEDGYAVPHVFRLPGFEPVKLPEIERGVVGLSSMMGQRLIYTLSNARTPGLAFELRIPERGDATAAPRRLTQADTQGLDLAAFRLPELVRYKSFDGLEVPAFLFLPADYVKGTPVPFVVNYHGGPESQFRPGFDRTVQFLVANGFGVLQPNVRGSTGYGRAFHMKDDYKKRWDSVRDGVHAARWLVENGYSAPGRMATFGGSYGGFMSVACLVEDRLAVERGEQTQPLFGAGINVVGIVNFRSFLERTAGYRRKLREVEYGPLSDPEFLAEVSPLRQADKIRVPVLIAHGFNDPRVPIDEAVQLALALRDQAFNAKRMDLMPQLLVFPDEGHGFAKLDNRLLFGTRMAEFLKSTIAK
jgi:dipeptidyl aminopeptidase/acylaminoacyl peptidase